MQFLAPFAAFFLFPSINCDKVKEKNVCSSYASYFFKDTSKNCYHSPDLYNDVVSFKTTNTEKMFTFLGYSQN